LPYISQALEYFWNLAISACLSDYARLEFLPSTVFLSFHDYITFSSKKTKAACGRIRQKNVEVSMLTEYIEEASKKAQYEIVDDEEPYYGEIKELKGVWATGKTLEECRSYLKEVIEGWILVSIKRGLSIPPIGTAGYNVA